MGDCEPSGPGVMDLKYSNPASKSRLNTKGKLYPTRLFDLLGLALPSSTDVFLFTLLGAEARLAAFGSKLPLSSWSIHAVAAPRIAPCLAARLRVLRRMVRSRRPDAVRDFEGTDAYSLK